MRVAEFRVEHEKEPIGIGTPHPRFSWQMEGPGRNKRQTAYHLLIKDKNRKVMWDMGEVQSEQSTHIRYDGQPLEPCRVYSCELTIRDEEGCLSDVHASAFETAWFGMFEARYISHPQQLQPEGGNIGLPAAYFRREFEVGQGVKRARLYATALGVYGFTINGAEVGNGHLGPDWTDYDQCLHYQTYDITGLLKEGANAAGAVLGDGWYTGFVAHCGRRMYGDYPLKLYALLMVEYENGSVQTVITDGSWKCSFGPIRQNDFLMGEYFDARLELDGYAQAGYDDSAWLPAQTHEEKPEGLEAQPCPPVRRTGEMRAREFWQTDVNTYVFDMGQNFAGRIRFRGQGNRGDKIRIRHGEMVYPLMYTNRRLYTENLRGALATDTYVFKGEGVEVYEPRFTFHGFQYVEVSGLTTTPSLDTVTGIVLHNDLEAAGSFECSNPLVNKLYSNIVWGQRSNFLAVPTDCPQRDERMGWLGDAQVFAKSGCYNMDSFAFYEKYLKDCAQAQYENGVLPVVAPNMKGLMGGPAAAWSDAVVIIPWVLYEMYGDDSVIRNHFGMMKKWVDFMKEETPDHIRPAGGFGDWLQIEAETPTTVMNTAFYAYSVLLFSRMAAFIGETEISSCYEVLFEQIKEAFNREFVAEDGRVQGDTQTCYLLALQFELLPQELRETAAWHLARTLEEKNGHLSTGFVGVSYLLPMLSRYGYNDVAYGLLEKTTYPSWLYSVVNGATTIWERWNSYTREKGFGDVGMNSFNHYSLGSVCEWMYGWCAGIRAGKPGFKHILIHPVMGGSITHAKAAYRSIYGMIRSSWKLENGKFCLEVTIPHNTTATVCLPGKAPFDIGSGEYEFEA